MPILFAVLIAGWLLVAILKKMENFCRKLAEAQEMAIAIEVGREQAKLEEMTRKVHETSAKKPTPVPELGQIQDAITGRVNTFPIRRLMQIKPERPGLN